MKTTDFGTYLSRYFTYYLVNERGSSPQTIESYRYAFILYLDYLESENHIQAENMNIKNFTRESILGYLDWLESKRNNSISTRNYRLAAMKGFVHYLKYEFPDYLEEYQRILGIPVKKHIVNEVSYMKPEGIDLLIKQIDLNANNGFRDYVILLLLYTTGVRVSELINIKVKDISLIEPFTIKVCGKGNKCRYVPLMKTAVCHMRKYLDLMKYDNTKYNEFLFLNHIGMQFTRQGINYIIAKYREKARAINQQIIPKDLSPHKIRHSAAMELLSSGVDLIYIRDLLGHSSVVTTEIYAKTDTKLRREAIEAASRNILPNEDATWDNNTKLKKWLSNFNK